jgi:hypothetical protein
VGASSAIIAPPAPSLQWQVIVSFATVSGVLGQIASSTGHMGCPALCCALFTAATVYMTVAWEKDLNSPRFMLSGFLSNMNNTLTTVRINKQVLVFTAITALCESSILVFSFYWAPWMDTIAREASQHLPYEVIFSSMILASMLGNYLFQMFARGSGAVSTPEAALQGLLVVSAAPTCWGPSSRGRASRCCARWWCSSAWRLLAVRGLLPGPPADARAAQHSHRGLQVNYLCTACLLCCACSAGVCCTAERRPDSNHDPLNPFLCTPHTFLAGWARW